MKKISIIIFLVLIVAGISGYFYWQKNKHNILKTLIVNSVSNYTDNLYTLEYDSSLVDELNGKAYFENITFKTDSQQLQHLKLVDNIPDILIDISIKSITATGLDVPSALKENKLFAKEIILNEPIITIIHTGKRTFKKEDSIALFKRILGNYNSIHAAHIEIIHAQLIDKTSEEIIHTKLTNLDMSFQDIQIDSTKEYRNVISYFIENMKAKLEQLYIYQPHRKSPIILKNIVYNSLDRNIIIDKISTKGEGEHEERYVLNAVKLEEINIKEFIENQTINVGNISTGECMLTLFINPKNAMKKNLGKTNNFDFPDDYFDKIKIGGISIGKSSLIIKSRDDPNKSPVRINGFTFHLSKNMKINERSSLRSLLDNANWDMQASDFSIRTKDNQYSIFFNGLKVDKVLGKASIQSIKVKQLKVKK